MNILRTTLIIALGLGVGLFIANRSKQRRLASELNDVGVSFSFPTTCELGELDAIDIDQYYGKSTGRFLITIESLDPKSDTNAHRELSRKEINAKETISLAVKSDSENLGLFLCSDNARQGSCRAKPRPPLTDIVVQDTRRFKQDANYIPADRTFYFLPIRSSQRAVKVLLAKHGGICR
jgi:hypothetical protein